MMITKYCAKCGTHTPHYVNHSQTRCQPCQKEASRKSKERMKAAGTLKPKEHKPKVAKVDNPTPKRDYNLMTAPEYMGENWENVRGQMQPTVRYVGVTG